MDELMNCVLYLSGVQKKRDLDWKVITFHSHRTTEVVDKQHRVSVSVQSKRGWDLIWIPDKRVRGFANTQFPLLHSLALLRNLKRSGFSLFFPPFSIFYLFPFSFFSFFSLLSFLCFPLLFFNVVKFKPDSTKQAIEVPVHGKMIWDQHICIYSAAYSPEISAERVWGEFKTKENPILRISGQFQSLTSQVPLLSIPFSFFLAFMKH